MVSSITTLPPQASQGASVQSSSARTASTTENERPGAARAAVVAVDPARLEHREDVLAAREDVADARDGVEFAIAAARDVRALLGEARDLAVRAADSATPDAARAAQDVAFRSAVQRLGQIVDGAIARGAPLLAGEALSVQADPDSDAATDIAGLDLRLKSAVTGDEALLLTRGASIGDALSAAETARAADKSLARLDAGLARLESEAVRLTQHDRVLGALDAALAANVAPDLGADGARLLALAVRQELSQSTAPIAGAKPNAVLSLFRE